MRKKYIVITSIVVALALIITSTFVFYKGNLGRDIMDLFSKKGGSQDYLVTEEIKLPDRPYILSTERVEEEGLGSYLTRQSVTAEDFMANSSLVADLHQADSLEDLVDSKEQVDNLRDIKLGLDTIFDRLSKSDDANEELVNDIFTASSKIGKLLTQNIWPNFKFEKFTALMGTWEDPDKVILR